MFDPVTAALAVGGLNFLGGQLTNQARSDQAQDQMAFQERMSNSSYQRQVADLSAAGLNPMLAYIKGGGASTPPGAMAQLENPVAAATSAYQTAASVGKTYAETENVEADTANKRANQFLIAAQTEVAGVTADEKRQNINNLEVQAKKISEEIKNIPLEGDRLIALVKNLSASTSLIRDQAQTEQQRAVQMKFLAMKTMLESDLLTFDVKSAQDLENLGRDSKQLQPTVQMLLDLTRVLKSR
jgi:hypothetical protein